MRTHERMVIAHHLILTGYGHWPSNDPRGSGSEKLRKPELGQVGEIHRGRKPEHLQPSRGALREFHRELKPLLEHAPIWFDAAKRQAVAEALGEVVWNRKYTCWACAICSNHVHLLIRRQRDDAITMWNAFKEGAADQLRLFADVGQTHRVWAERPYKVFMYTPQEVSGCVAYIEKNPEKEGLARQIWEFVTAYDGWPHAAKRQAGRNVR
ncbi:MAG: hypothetical protein L0Y42_04905 [Phycisphaerales bacterium]|nr:hypothetical protein [Phycisphaerales bacterium]